MTSLRDERFDIVGRLAGLPPPAVAVDAGDEPENSLSSNRAGNDNAPRFAIERSRRAAGHKRPFAGARPGEPKSPCRVAVVEHPGGTRFATGCVRKHCRGLYIERISGVIGVLEFPFQVRREEEPDRSSDCADALTAANRARPTASGVKKLCMTTGNLPPRKAPTKFFLQSNHL
jgi:hypothetical protein